MGLDLLHLLSRRRALYRNAGRRQPGEAGRHHACPDRSDWRDVRSGPRSLGGRVGLTWIAVDWFLRRSPPLDMGRALMRAYSQVDSIFALALAGNRSHRGAGAGIRPERDGGIASLRVGCAAGRLLRER